MENQVETIDVALSTTKIREFAKGEDGQLISLVDIQHTKSILKGMVKKFEKIVVTKENYKEVPKEAERELREARYALQNIHKNNKDILNKAKKDEKEVFDELIAIIKPMEDSLKTSIDAIENEVKLEKERLEKERLEKEQKIKDEIQGYKDFFKEKITEGKTQEDLVDYNKKLDELEERVLKEEFGDYNFDAEDAHAMFIGERKKLEKRIEELAQIEADKKAIEEEKKKKEELAEKVLMIRLKELEKLGVDPSDISDEWKEEIKAKDEVEWFDYKEDLQSKQKETETQQNQELLIQYNDKHEKLKEFKHDFKLEEGQSVTQEILDNMDALIEAEKAKQKTVRLKEINLEIDPFRKRAKRHLKDLKEIHNSNEYGFPESKQIIEGFINEMEKTISDCLE